eukprot:s6_g16.t1
MALAFSAPFQPQIAESTPPAHRTPPVPRASSDGRGLPLAASSMVVAAAAVARRKRTSRQALKEKDQPMLSGIKGPVNLVKDGEVEGLPWWWEAFWALPFTERGKKGEPLCLGDTMHVFRTTLGQGFLWAGAHLKNIEQIFGGEPSYDGAPLATGDLASAGLTDGTMYLGLQKYQENFGDVYKLCFGPKSFMVVSDPQILKHMLRENVFNYDKGVLGEVLEDVMGKGLIPADFETWRVRRRAIVPGFHKKWLDFQVSEFGRAAQLLVKSLHEAAAAGKTIDMEERFGSVALDIIGKSVFNYEFGSVEGESPVVKAAIQSLREVEHRAQTPFQYWKLPLMDVLIERQREFTETWGHSWLMHRTIRALPVCDVDNQRFWLDLQGFWYRETDNRCVGEVCENRLVWHVQWDVPETVTSLQAVTQDTVVYKMAGRVVSGVICWHAQPSIREATSGKQLRDDMITMLIAGHETTASALTWGLFELAQNPELMGRLQKDMV